jgi:hypothetical protein
MDNSPGIADFVIQITFFAPGLAQYPASGCTGKMTQVSTSGFLQ